MWLIFVPKNKPGDFHKYLNLVTDLYIRARPFFNGLYFLLSGRELPKKGNTLCLMRSMCDVLLASAARLRTQLTTLLVDIASHNFAAACLLQLLFTSAPFVVFGYNMCVLATSASPTSRFFFLFFLFFLVFQVPFFITTFISIYAANEK